MVPYRTIPVAVLTVLSLSVEGGCTLTILATNYGEQLTGTSTVSACIGSFRLTDYSSIVYVIKNYYYRVLDIFICLNRLTSLRPGYQNNGITNRKSVLRCNVPVFRQGQPSFHLIN